MNHNSVRIFFAAVLLALPASAIQAGNADLDIHCFPKRTDQDAAGAAASSGSVTKESWAYDVAIENRTFKDLASLEVKYVIFVQPEQAGGQAAAPLRRKTGGFTIDALKSREKKLSTTIAVELKKTRAPKRRSRSATTKPAGAETLAGLWVRVYQNGQLLAEYANPSSLMTQQKWE